MSLPKVSIILLAHLESNRPYFEACLRSVQNLDYPKDLLDVIVISPYVGRRELLDAAFVLKNYKRAQSFSGSVNTGFEAISRDSEYILLLSDDTIITKNALMNFVTMAKDMPDVLMGPISNCDIGWKYAVNLPVTGQERYYKFGEETTPEVVWQMMNSASPVTAPLVLMTDTLCFYAFFVKRSTWEKVGELDETYRMGHEDSDWTHRAKLLGIMPMVNMNALIYHAGGASESIITDEMRASNEKYFKEKWSIK